MVLAKANLDLEGTVSDPTGDKCTRVIRRAAKGHENSTILGVSDLSDEKGRRAKDNAVAETKKDTRRDKHAKVLGSSL